MSDMVKRYNESTKLRVQQSQQIPSLAVNFFDQDNVFQTDFTPNEKRGDPTHFTKKAQQYYNESVKTILTPSSFQPIDVGVPLHRYTPEKGYYDPGQTK